MPNLRHFSAAVVSRSLVFATIAALGLAIFGHMRIPALALMAGTLIGLAYLFHIATSFNRLTKGGKGYLPFLTIESLVRVFVAGAAPLIIVGRGPWLGYFTYLAGFVAPLAVSILTYRKQISIECAQTETHEKISAQTST
jgi:hypothetical protein